MQNIFELTRVNFQQAIKIGDIFEHENERYVITHILKIKRVLAKGGFVARVITQQVGTKPIHDDFQSIGIFEARYKK